MELKKVLNWKEWYQAMMTGISYMVPVIVAGGILQAIPNLWTDGAASAATEGVAFIMYNWGSKLFGMMYYVLQCLLLSPSPAVRDWFRDLW